MTDAWMMAWVHRNLLYSFEDAASLVPGVPPDDPARLAQVAGYLDFPLAGLSAHHSTEDELLWPKLLERVPPGEAWAAHIERMEAQHVGLHDDIERVQTASSAWRAGVNPDTAAAVVAAVLSLVGRLKEHLSDEETNVVPLIEEYITPQEWDAAGEVSFGKFTDEQQLLATGIGFEVSTPVESERLRSEMPPPVLEAWDTTLSQVYAARIAAIRGIAVKT